MTTATQPLQFEAWKGFEPGPWAEGIDVRDFIQRNYTPYDGDASFLAGPTEKTLRTWDTLEKEYLSVERQKRIFDVDTHTPTDIDAFPAGYISEDDDVIVGLQTDTPLKRAMMPSRPSAKRARSQRLRSRRSSLATARPTTMPSSTSTLRASALPDHHTSSPVCLTHTAAAASSVTTVVSLSTALTTSSPRRKPRRTRSATWASASTGLATVKSTQSRSKP